MEIKRGVDVRFLHQEIVSKLWNIEQIFLFHAPQGFKLVITSGSDGEHMKDSKHYRNTAIDVRVWYLSTDGHLRFVDADVLAKIVADIKSFLGDWYDVFVEYRTDQNPSHVHIEFDP